MSETARSAHGRVFQGCLVSETAQSAHGRVFQGCLVSKTEHSAHGRVFQGCLVSETACSAHGRVCRCAFGRRRVCVVTEESRHPYVILPCTPERQKGAEVSPKRASLHSRATISAKSVALEWREEGFWNDQRSINGWFCSCQRQKRIRRWHYMEKMRPS